ncbi:MAG: cytochrome P460 family protein [Kiloniellales bacterium]|nr:cytochrome P460 family protein [Kiloniellales bacterium]
MRTILSLLAPLALLAVIGLAAQAQAADPAAGKETVALQAAREGGDFPNESLLFVEVFTAKLDADGMPIEGADGHFEPDQLTTYTAMEKQAGWGDSVPEILRNGDWRYAVFATDKTHKPGINEAKCFACHKPLTDVDYVFSLVTLKEKARAE